MSLQDIQSLQIDHALETHLHAKTTISPVSNAHAEALRNTYRNSGHHASIPKKAKRLSSQAPEEKCTESKRRRTRHKFTTQPTPWQGDWAINMGIHQNVYTTDPRGFIPDQKLTSSGMKPQYGQHEATFPKMQGINRIWRDEKLYPQYGSLKSSIFRQKPRPTPQKKKKKNVAKRQDIIRYFPEGFEPFLMETFSDSTILKRQFPVPFRNMNGHDFGVWFTESMVLIGMGIDFIDMKLTQMEAVENKARDIEAAEAQRRRLEIEFQNGFLPKPENVVTAVVLVEESVALVMQEQGQAQDEGSQMQERVHSIADSRRERDGAEAKEKARRKRTEEKIRIAEEERKLRWEKSWMGRMQKSTMNILTLCRSRK